MRQDGHGRHGHHRGRPGDTQRGCVQQNWHIPQGLTWVHTSLTMVIFMYYMYYVLYVLYVIICNLYDMCRVIICNLYDIIYIYIYIYE